MENSSQICNCHMHQPEIKKQRLFLSLGKTTGTISSTLTSVLIAFFPKCPLCWAVYMSTLGGLGFTKLHYMPWLLPVLIVFLTIHLILILKQIRRKGYLPFLVSFSGAALIITGRIFSNEGWLLESGIALILSGSLLNGFINIYTNKQNLEAHN